jgi:hypothetical protein
MAEFSTERCKEPTLGTNIMPQSIDIEKESTGHCGGIFVVLHVDRIMTKYIIVI